MLLAPSKPNAIPGPSHVFSLDEMRTKPLDFILEMTETYGDVVRYHVGDWPCTIINHPDAVQRVLQDNHRNYKKIGTPDVTMLKPMLGNGLLTSDGDEWLKQRRMTQPAFHRKAIAGFGRMMTDLSTKMLQGWDNAAAAGQEIQVDEAMTQLTLRIVAKALFGYDVADNADRFGHAVEELNECMGHTDAHNPDKMRRFPIALKTVHDIVREIIWVRRLTGSNEFDLLSMLTAATSEGGKVSERSLLEQVVTLILAGHETTAKALAWTLYLLDQNRDVEQKLHEEVDRVLEGRTPTLDDIPNLPYLTTVIQESMRIRPPIWLVSRIAIQDDEMLGHHIPAGSLAVISPYALHRHDAFWHNPNKFDPSHFSPERIAARPSYAYIPFSGGPRLCVGKSFAMMEAQLVLAMVAQRYHVRLKEGHPVEVEALVTLRPQAGLPMRLEMRL